MPQKLTKSSSSIWHYVVSVKSRVKISSIFVAFLENTNFTIQGRRNWKNAERGGQSSGVIAPSPSSFPGSDGSAVKLNQLWSYNTKFYLVQDHKQILLIFILIMITY